MVELTYSLLRPSLGAQLFLLKNRRRLQQYEIMNQASFFDMIDGKPNQYFNVAVHIRRGDILDPGRWIDQQVFANVAKYICQTNTIKDKSFFHEFSCIFVGSKSRWELVNHGKFSAIDWRQKQPSSSMCERLFSFGRA